jgi:hypothetical protein
MGDRDVGGLVASAREPAAPLQEVHDGMLLAAMDGWRPTRDLDMLATAASNDVEAVRGLIRQIAGIASDDGVHFDAAALRPGPSATAINTAACA